MNERAIHIELAPDMRTQDFIQALIRFCNVCGRPTHLYSDNRWSFHAALGEDIIKHYINSTEFSNAYTNSGIKHIFVVFR